MKSNQFNFIVLAVSLFSVAAVAAPKKEAVKAAPHAAATHTFARNYGAAGCGLGSVVMGKNDMQVFAATTNGTSLNQLFGISLGTLNCVDSNTAKTAMNMDKFIQFNRIALASDLARGQGETLTHIASILGCQGQSVAVAKALRDNGSAVSSALNSIEKTEAVTDRIITVIMNQHDLALSCSNLVS